jgi:UDP-N-acetylmuramoyl-L-alanyl-D-glutamate--2,6-diaminopimelate ligase
MSLRSLVKKLIPRSLFHYVEPYGHWCEAVLFNILYGFPARKMKVIGVTGTNGKTTTSYLVHRMLHEAGYKAGLMSTVGYGVGSDINLQIHHMTNVSAPELMKRLKWMKSKDVEWLVLETTSHALAQYRVWGVPYSVAVFTNITHEHLAYHRTFERYREAKRRLFTIANRNKKGLRTGIINAEDPSADVFIKSIAHPITYGIDKGDLRAQDVVLTPKDVSYTVKTGEDTYHIRCQIPGTFNVYNSLAALGVGRAIGLSVKQVEQGIAALEGVEGRMTTIDAGQDFTVIVDYAHTPDSFEKLFKDIKPVVKGKLIVLFGSLGQGDRGKRPLQGKLAGEYADEVILCEEDDRKEDGQTILEEIAAGVEPEGKIRGKDLFFVHDRPEAIAAAFSRAKKDDTVLLLGKGHEKTIEHADGEHPWNEAEVAYDTLHKLLKTKK